MMAGWLCLGLFAVPSYPAEVVGHVDGDTVAIQVQVWPAANLVIPRVLVRLRGIDTPELRQAACEAERTAGRQAAARLAALLPTGRRVVLENPTSDAYTGRVVGDLRLAGAAATLSHQMVQEGWAVPMPNPKRSTPWCPTLATRPYPFRADDP